MIEQIIERPRHEIGVHGWIHENLSRLDDPAEERRLLDDSIDYLTRTTGKRPVGFRAPSRVFSAYTIGLIQDAGFLYDSSLMAMDEPYEIVSEASQLVWSSCLSSGYSTTRPTLDVPDRSHHLN